MKGRTEIRPLSIEDLRSIYTLGREFFGEQGPACMPPWNETSLADILSRDAGLSLVAVTKKKITGFLIASHSETEGISTATIRWLCIQRANSTVLDDMLSRFKSMLFEKNIDKIMVALPESNSELIQYYRNFGFTESKRFIIMENFLSK